MTEFLETSCGWCGAPIRDYASNRRKAKGGKYYCSTACAGKGRAYAISVALGGEPLESADDFQHGKRNRDAVDYRKHVDRRRSKANEYYREHSGDVIAKRRAKDRALKQEIIDAYGGKCECCGEITFEFLTIDHINGDGAEHRRQIGGKGRRLYAAIKAEGFPKDRYRLLCFNCNIALGFYGYCPHHPERKSSVSRVPFNPGRKRTVE